MPDDLGEKTEAATPRRRQESRDEGNVARSQDLTASIMLLGAVLLLYVFAMHVLSGMKSLMQSMLGGAAHGQALANPDLPNALARGLTEAGRTLAPLALGILLLGIIGNLVQVGFILSARPIQPRLSKLSPLRGVQQLFSMRSLMRLVMSLAKVAVVAAVALLSIWSDLPAVLTLTQLGAGALFAGAASLVFNLALRIAIVLLILALLDYMFQRWQHEKDIRMSKQEVREEHKRLEGDPLTRQRRTKIARQLTLQRIAMAVPKADVVVTNPTHFAVAMRYDGKTMVAPKVVAKGADFLALRIRQLALAYGVPLVERPELARALYRTVEVGQEIPPEYYSAVAEILAYVYRLSEKKSA